MDNHLSDALDKSIVQNMLHNSIELVYKIVPKMLLSHCFKVDHNRFNHYNLLIKLILSDIYNKEANSYFKNVIRNV